MKQPLAMYRTTRPVQLYGRVAGTGELLRLPQDQGDALVAEGYLVPAVNGGHVAGEAQPAPS